MISSYETKYIKCSEFLSKYDLNIINKPFIPTKTAQNGLNFITKDEEGYITRSFFKSFRENFKQATLMWLMLLVVFILLVADFMIFRFSGIVFPGWCQIALIAIAVLIMFATMHLFPLLSRYENSIRATYKNSLFMGILHLPKTILMMLCWIVPIVITIYVESFFPIVFFLGISGPAFLNALLYKKSFQQLEPETEIKSDADWTVQAVSEEETEEETEEKP